MANRQDSGSSPAHENQRPVSHNEDAIPEMQDDTRGRLGAEDDDTFDESDMEEVDEEEEGEDEGNY